MTIEQQKKLFSQEQINKAAVIFDVWVIENNCRRLARKDCKKQKEFHE